MKKSTVVKLFVLIVAILAIALVMLNANNTKISIEDVRATSETRLSTCQALYPNNESEQDVCMDDLKTIEAGG